MPGMRLRPLMFACVPLRRTWRPCFVVRSGSWWRSWTTLAPGYVPPVLLRTTPPALTPACRPDLIRVASPSPPTSWCLARVCSAGGAQHQPHPARDPALSVAQRLQHQRRIGSGRAVTPGPAGHDAFKLHALRDPVRGAAWVSAPLHPLLAKDGGCTANMTVAHALLDFFAGLFMGYWHMRRQADFSFSVLCLQELARSLGGEQAGLHP